MKSLIVLTLAFFVRVAFADSPKGMVDVPFGASVNDAQAAFSGRDGLKPEAASGDRLKYTGGTFAGHPVAMWTLNFADGKFASGTIVIEKAKKPVYDELKADLVKKYGKQDSEKGHHSWESVWEFRSEGKRSVRLQFEHEGRVIVTYAHEGIAKAAKSSKKSDI